MPAHGSEGRGRALAVAALAGALLLVGALSALAVREATPSPEAQVACNLELGVRFSPPDTAIAVGASFAPAVALSTCLEGSATADRVTWAAADTAVARVDAATGRTTGRAPGTTQVAATGRRFGRIGAVRVVVRAAP